MIRPRHEPLGPLVAGAVMMALSLYFLFSAVQGDFGLFRRAGVEADHIAAQAELARLEREVARMEVLTRRLSDGFLDLDLLDQQARDVLGLVRPDEIVIR